MGRVKSYPIRHTNNSNTNNINNNTNETNHLLSSIYTTSSTTATNHNDEHSNDISINIGVTNTASVDEGTNQLHQQHNNIKDNIEITRHDTKTFPQYNGITEILGRQSRMISNPTTSNSAVASMNTNNTTTTRNHNSMNEILKDWIIQDLVEDGIIVDDDGECNNNNNNKIDYSFNKLRLKNDLKQKKQQRNQQQQNVTTISTNHDIDDDRKKRGTRRTMKRWDGTNLRNDSHYRHNNMKKEQQDNDDNDTDNDDDFFMNNNNSNNIRQRSELSSNHDDDNNNNNHIHDNNTDMESVQLPTADESFQDSDDIDTKDNMKSCVSSESIQQHPSNRSSLNNNKRKRRIIVDDDLSDDDDDADMNNGVVVVEALAHQSAVTALQSSDTNFPLRALSTGKKIQSKKKLSQNNKKEISSMYIKQLALSIVKSMNDSSSRNQQEEANDVVSFNQILTRKKLVEDRKKRKSHRKMRTRSSSSHHTSDELLQQDDTSDMERYDDGEGDDHGTNNNKEGNMKHDDFTNDDDHIIIDTTTTNRKVGIRFDNDNKKTNDKMPKKRRKISNCNRNNSMEMKKVHFPEVVDNVLDTNSITSHDIRIIWNSSSSNLITKTCNMNTNNNNGSSTFCDDQLCSEEDDEYYSSYYDEEDTHKKTVSIQYYINNDSMKETDIDNTSDVTNSNKSLRLASFLLPHYVTNIVTIQRKDHHDDADASVLSKIDINNNSNNNNTNSNGISSVDNDNKYSDMYFLIQSATSVSDLLQLINNGISSNETNQLYTSTDGVESVINYDNNTSDLLLDDISSSNMIKSAKNCDDIEMGNDNEDSSPKNVKCTTTSDENIGDEKMNHDYYHRFLFIKNAITQAVRDKTILAFLVTKKREKLVKSSSVDLKCNEVKTMTDSEESVVSLSDSSINNLDISLSLQLFLSETAFELCSPIHVTGIRSMTLGSNPSLSISSCTLKRRNEATRLKNVARVSFSNLLLAIASLFPNSILTDLVLHASKTTQSNRSKSVECNITAKQVYGLTDNVQLKKALLPKKKHARNENIELNMDSAQRVHPVNDDSGPKIESKTTGLTTPRNLSTFLHSHGLVPKLRPYQEHAVEWMIQRETATRPTLSSRYPSNEWQLAWYVIPSVTEFALYSQARFDDHQSQHVNLFPQIEFLPDYLKRQIQLCSFEKNNDIEEMYQFRNILLLNPFTGWLARTIDQAYHMTFENSDQKTTSSIGQYVKGGILAESMGLGTYYICHAGKHDLSLALSHRESLILCLIRLIEFL